MFYIVGLSFFIVFISYYNSTDSGSCTVRNAEMQGVDGYYYATGGEYIQRGKPGLAWLQPIDFFSILNWRDNNPSSSFQIHLTKQEWSIRDSTGTVYQNQVTKSMGGLPVNAEDYLFSPPSNGWTMNTGDPSSPARLSTLIMHCSGSLSSGVPTAAQSSPSKVGSAPSNIQQLLDRPVTTMLLFSICFYAYHLHTNAVDPSVVAFSYEKIVSEGEWSRLFTSAASHFDLMHLGFNTMTLYQIGPLEEEYGSARYAYLSFALVLVTGCICLLLTYVMIHRLHREDARHQQAVGYSCVLFAWITCASVRMQKFCPVIFAPDFCFNTLEIPVIGLPVNFGPIVLLVITKVIIPRSSLIGHLSGILIGFPLAWNLLDWMHPLWLLSALAAVYILHAREYMWVWNLPLSSSIKQDMTFVLHSADSLIRKLGGLIEGAYGTALQNTEHVYSTVSINEENVSLTASAAVTVTENQGTGTCLGIPCLTVDNAWLHAENAMTEEQIVLYDKFRWMVLVTMLWGVIGAIRILQMLMGYCNLALFLLCTAFPLFMLLFLLWAAHQAVRLCYLSDVTSTVRASIQLLVLSLLFTIVMTVNTAATIGAFYGSYGMIDVNTIMSDDGHMLNSDVTSTVFVYDTGMLILEVTLIVLQFRLLCLVPTVERGDAMRRMRVPWLLQLVETQG